ncbi:MAG: hypothetical protein MJY61_02960 [Bacteroidales bacterium]|nr:hypothetical protein [Bacteroidales bacterium]
MDRDRYLDNFESVLEGGLLKICKSSKVLDETCEQDGRVFLSPDIEQVWDRFVKDYVGDAVENFNEFPDAAIGFAGFLGMAVAHFWDSDWDSHREDGYADYYGSRGFDDMDDHILADVLKLDESDSAFTVSLMKSLSMAVQVLLRREQIESQTDIGFYALVRSYGVVFRVGAAVELYRLGYRKTVSDYTGSAKTS